MVCRVGRWQHGVPGPPLDASVHTAFAAHHDGGVCVVESFHLEAVLRLDALVRTFGPAGPHVLFPVPDTTDIHELSEPTPENLFANLSCKHERVTVQMTTL